MDRIEGDAHGAGSAKGAGGAVEASLLVFGEAAHENCHLRTSRLSPIR
jgi:hypothetical protein